MLSAITGVMGSIFSGLSSLVSALVQWASVIFAYRLGGARERQKATEKTARIQDDQLKIVAKPKLRRNTLLRRMRKRSRRE